ncbi:MAG: hypothetical protein ACKO7R_12190 [Pseudanabaena sp.]
MMTLTITDETFTGDIINSISLDFEKELITVAEIIEQRVRKEVENYNAKMSDYFQGLVMPSDAEKSLNGYKIKNKRTIDAEQQAYIALGAFQKNGFFVLIDDKQAEDLNEKVLLHNKIKVSFIKLTPLVGG